MNSKTIYLVPELQCFDVGSHDFAPEFVAETTILRINRHQKQRYWRPYRVCYLDRVAIDKDAKLKDREKVNINSLCLKRTRLISKYIRSALEGQSGLPLFTDIETALDWVDAASRNEQLYNIDGAKSIYQDFTHHLNHRRRLSKTGSKRNKNSLSNSTANRYQQALAYVCSQSCGMPISTIKSWSISITTIKNNGVPAPATTDHEHSLAHSIHRRFFDAFADAVLNDQHPPAIVILSDLGFDDVIFYSQNANNANGWSQSSKDERTDWKSVFYSKNGIFSGSPKEFNLLLSEIGIDPIGTSAFKRLQNNNSEFSPVVLQNMANIAARHFGYLMLAESGCNAQHLASIDCNQTRLEKAVGLARSRAIKGRSGFEDQHQFVDARFAQTCWKKYLRLRAWMSSRVENPPTRGIFLIGDTRAGRRAGIPYHLTYSSMKQLSLWPQKAPSLATRAARKHKSVNLLEATKGNYTVVAAMQYAKPKTIEKHYAFANQLQAAESMTEYFRAQAKSAKLRDAGVQAIRIIEGGESVGSGHCDTIQEGPELIPALAGTEIQPRCGAPVTCIFCIHFGLHANEDELLTLLSISHWAETTSRINSANIDEHYKKFAPFQNRIEQIIEGIKDLELPLKALVEKALVRFQQGERDPYWQAKITALIEAQES
ncbi:MAG: hypothetical protein COB09_10600 [Thalassobium sp.]|nr:MAG: hypothetical protein COB09_10600 [Thalassobium sp.]